MIAWTKTKNRGLREQEGVALVITLVVVTILATLLVELTHSTHVNVRIAATFRDDLGAYYVARSGIELALAVLRMDFEDDQEDVEQGKQKGREDNLGELWATLGEAVASAQMLEPELFSGGRLLIRIVDEDRKINVNLINQDSTAPLIERLFEELEIAQDFRNALADWIDEDQEERYPGGAESRYYESLDIPYPCKDGPMDTISELRMVKGGEEALKKAFETLEGESGAVDQTWNLEGLLSTAPGRGPNINVNTAPGPVILALHDDIDRVHAQEAVGDRAADPFPRVDAFRDYFNNNFGISDLPPHLTVHSEYFSIESVGVVGEVEKRLLVTVRRDPNNGALELISWRVE